MASFDSPCLLGSVNLTEVVDAGIGLCGLTGMDEIRNRNRGQQTNNGHHDHDFHECEARLAGCVSFHTTFTLPSCAVNNATGGFTIITIDVHSLPVATAGRRQLKSEH